MSNNILNKENQTILAKGEESLLSSLFSLNGTLGRLGFFGVFLLLNSILVAVSKYGGLVGEIIIYPFVFYSSVAAIQKRCRDFKFNGTIGILIFSIAFPLIECLKYIKNNEIYVEDNVKSMMILIASPFLVLQILLLLIPGSKNKILHLSSPLLKRPYLYTGICFVIFLLIMMSTYFYARI